MANENDDQSVLQYSAPAQSRAAATWAFLKQLGPVGPVALISMTVPGVMGFVLLGMANYHKAAIHRFVADDPMLAVVCYIAGFAILAGLPLLPTYAISLVGGYFLGMQWGFCASIVGYTGASLVSFIFLRVLSGDRVERVIAEHPKWKIVRDEMLIRSPWRTIGIIALLRLPPNLPFAVINLVLVTARTHLMLYLVGSILGVIPRTLAVAYIASVVKDLTSSENATWGWMPFVGIGITVVVLGIVTHIARRALRKITDKNTTQ